MYMGLLMVSSVFFFYKPLIINSGTNSNTIQLAIYYICNAVYFPVMIKILVILVIEAESKC